MKKEEFARIRKKLGFTQVQLAKALHLSSKSISDYETGKAKIPYLVAKIMKMNFALDLAAAIIDETED